MGENEGTTAKKRNYREEKEGITEKNNECINEMKTSNAPNLTRQALSTYINMTHNPVKAHTRDRYTTIRTMTRDYIMPAFFPPKTNKKTTIKKKTLVTTEALLIHT